MNVARFCTAGELNNWRAMFRRNRYANATVQGAAASRRCPKPLPAAQTTTAEITAAATRRLLLLFCAAPTSACCCSSVTSH
ncbi:hypothetical protein [Fischerella sp. PCC 9605]|uniref:hypothetical protein n=1 Tax=Fischerella sp. PCC 9605 TaxID=1173024 RepID=UPI0018CC1DC8|nr:hypothetical protein [Fischerella sp. PCC 9605]